MSKVINIPIGSIIEFPYENHQGKKAIRKLRVEGIQHVQNEYYPKPTWCVKGYDFDKQAWRSFSLARIDPTQIRFLD